jgi:hypothetical protein
VKRTVISWEAIPFIDPVTGAGILYDHNVAQVAAVTVQ